MQEYIESIKSKTTITPKTILEIGSRDGDDAELLRIGFNINSNNVFLVEPNPNQHSKIENKYPNVNLFKCAIGKEEIKAIFNVVEDEHYIGVSSLIDRNDGFYSKVKSSKIEVEVLTGVKLLELINQSIDVCKVDVEGLTLEVLQSFFDSIIKIKSFHLECEHQQVWKDQKLYDDVCNFLIKKGFEEIYFSYCGGGTLQSDSIWVQKNYVKQ